MPDLKSKKNWFYFFILNMALVVGILAFNIKDNIHFNEYDHPVLQRLVSYIVFQNLGMMAVIIDSVIMDEEFPPKTKLGVNFVSALTYIVAGGLYLGYYCYDKRKSEMHYGNMVICNGVFCLILAVLHITEFFLEVFKKKIDA